MVKALEPKILPHLPFKYTFPWNIWDTKDFEWDTPDHDWCFNHCEGRFESELILDFHGASGIYYMTFHFEFESDAVLFKLSRNA